MDTFPFVGIGGLTALVSFVVTYTAFAGLVRLLGGVASGVRTSVVPGIVEGVREWARPEHPEAEEPQPEWEELPPGGDQLGAE